MKKRTINGKVYVITPEEQEGTCFGCAFDGYFCSYSQPECENGMILKALETEETKKSNLKPFNLEEAKAGKPVCTRDGRKARIICFDRIDSTGCNLPIVALIQCEGTEVLQLYHDDGKRDVKADIDLMMLSEKRD